MRIIGWNLRLAKFIAYSLGILSDRNDKDVLFRNCITYEEEITAKHFISNEYDRGGGFITMKKWDTYRDLKIKLEGLVDL